MNDEEVITRFIEACNAKDDLIMSHYAGRIATILRLYRSIGMEIRRDGRRDMYVHDKRQGLARYPE